MAREKGVVMYIVPFTTIGVHSKALRVVQRLPSLTSPVWKIHAGCSRWTFLRVISFNGEYFEPRGSPPPHD